MEFILGTLALASVSGVVSTFLSSVTALAAWNALCMGSTVITYATLFRGRRTHKHAKAV